MQLNFRKFGHKPPLVIAHGLFGSASNWQSIAKRLCDDYQVFAVDLRNHGQSPHDDDMSYQAMAADLLEFIDTHCGGHAALVGHSMGGKAAMAAALLGPEQVDRLGVVDIAPVNYESALGRYAELMRDMPLNEVSRRQDADQRLQREIPNPAVRAFLLHNLRRDRSGAWYWRVNLDVIVRDLPVIAGWPSFDREFEKPTVFIGGLQSEYLDQQHWPAVRARFPNARIEMLADAGHWVHAEQPERVTGLIEQLMQQ